jgi:hypothetical protein
MPSATEGGPGKCDLLLEQKTPLSVVSWPVALSTRTLMILTVILLVAVAVAAVLAWWVTRQPPLTPIEVPSVSVG